jgi:hypothetical protein
MRSAGTVRPARHRQNALMEPAIAFEGGVLGGLVVSDMHVARKGNAHRIVGAPAPRALGLEQGNALANHVERCAAPKIPNRMIGVLIHAASLLARQRSTTLRSTSGLANARRSIATHTHASAAPQSKRTLRRRD